MTVTPVASLRVAVQAGAVRRDVAVAPHATVAALVQATGVDPRSTGLLVVASDGRVLDLDAELGEVVAPGALVHLVVASARPTEPDDQAREGRPRDGAGRRGAGWWALAVALAAVAVAVSGWSVLDGVAPDRDLALLGAALLGLAAIVTATAGPTGGRAGVAATGGAVLLGLAAGYVSVDPTAYAAGQLAVVVALLAGSVAAAMRYAGVYRRDPPAAAAPGVVLALVLLVAVLATAVLLAGWPGHAAAAAALGAGPLVLRALPSLSIDVPDSLLLDVGVVQRTAASVREPEPRPPGRIREATVQRAVRTAEARRDAGALVVALAAPVLAAVTLRGAPVVGTGPLLDRLSGYAAVATVAAVATAYALGPRTARGAVATVAPRLASAVLAVELAITVGTTSATSAAVLPAALVAIGGGLVAVGLVRPLAAGWRSVRWSRTADIVESTVVVLAAPLGLVAAGTVAAMRLLASG